MRETQGADEHRTFSGELRAGRLYLTTARNGERVKSDVAAPDDARFPFAARELFLRESKALGGVLDARVFDPESGAFRTETWREAASRPLRVEGRSLEARVVTRTHGNVTEREWLAPDGPAVLAELNGPGTVAIATTRGAVARLGQGDTEAVTGPDSAARTRFADPVRGWSIEKPDPTWTFEKPETAGSGALLVVRNEPMFATVDVLTDPEARKSTRPEDAAEALQRLCRAVAPDFTVARDGWIEKGDDRVYWMEATATTKGEKTRTLARVVVKNGVVWRLLAACPAAAFRPELEKILDSFCAN